MWRRDCSSAVLGSCVCQVVSSNSAPGNISFRWYFAVISMSGVFAVTFSVIFAYVADITQEHERSTAYGLVRIHITDSSKKYSSAPEFREVRCGTILRVTSPWVLHTGLLHSSQSTVSIAGPFLTPNGATCLETNPRAWCCEIWNPAVLSLTVLSPCCDTTPCWLPCKHK